MKRIVLGLLLLVLCAVVALAGFGAPYLTAWLRQRLEYEIGRAMDVPTRVDALALSAPLAVRVTGIVVGGESPIARIDRVDVRVQVLDSLAERRPVLTASVNAASFDLLHLPQRHVGGVPAGPAARRGLPPVHLKRLEITDARMRFRMGNNPATLVVARLAGGLNSDGWRGRLSGEIEAQGVELHRNSHQLTVSEVRASGGQDAGGWFVDGASLQGEGITATVSATSTPHRHQITAMFDPGLLGIVADELSFIGGQASVEGDVLGDLANPLLEAHVVVENAAIAQHALGNLDTLVTLAGSSLRFGNVHLVSSAGEATGSVDLILEKETPLDGELQWQGVDLEGLLAIIGAPVPFRNRLAGSTSVHGTLDPLNLAITGSGALQAVGADSPRQAARWQLGGRVRPGTVETEFELTQPAVANRLGGQFALNRGQLGGAVTLTAADLASLSTILPHTVRPLSLQGRAEASAAFAGTTEHPRIAGTVAMREMTIVGARVPGLDGDFALAEKTLTTRRTRIETDTGTAELTGVVALAAGAQNSWQLSLRDLSTDVVLGVVSGFSGVQSPVGGGTISGAARCRGQWAQAEIQADLSASAVRLGREPLAHVDVHATSTPPGWTLQLTAVHGENDRLEVDGRGEGRDRLDVRIDTTPWDLAKWRRTGRRHMVGTVDLHGRISGETLRPDGWMQLNGSGLGISARQIGDVTLRAEGRRGEWTLRGGMFEGTIVLDATLRTAGAFPYSLSGKWRDADLARLISDDKSLHVTSSGEVNLAGSLREVNAPTGTVLVPQFEVRRENYRIGAAEPIRIEVDRGRFRVRSLVLEGEGSRLTAGGEWTTSGDVALEVHGDADLTLLELIGPPFQSSRGQVTATARLQRAAGTGWDLHGQVLVRNAVVDAGLPVVFTDTNADFAFVGSHIRIDQLAGKMGGGSFTVAGAIDVNRGPELAWTIKEVSLNVPDWLEERVSGSGRVDGTWRAMTVSGDVEILNALYDRRIELTDLVPWFKAQVTPVPRGEAAATEVRLDLRVHASGGLFVDNNFAKAEMRADLRISGNTDNPVLKGTVEIISGEVTFRKRTFVVTGGSIDFRDPLKINPVLNISAESQISTSEAQYTVFVVVSGTAESPRVQFSADDPTLSQNDILSLVTAGRTMAQAQREGGGGVGVTDVLALVPTETVEQQFRTLLGVDRFEIEPVYSHDTGTVEPRVTIGKDLTERLRVQGASGVGVDAHRSMQVEYRATRRISLLGMWEEQTQQQEAAYGGDIKFRYQFRKLPFSLLGGESVCVQQGDAQ